MQFNLPELILIDCVQINSLKVQFIFRRLQKIIDCSQLLVSQPTVLELHITFPLRGYSIREPLAHESDKRI